MSWFSLLLHEKENAEVTADDRKSAAYSHTTSEQQSRVRASLHGIAEDLISNDLGSMRLEVRDGLGAPVGHLEPASKPGRCILACQGEEVAEIDLHANRSITVSENSTVRALATHQPEHPEQAGKEDEHLQVDIREAPDGLESSLVLISVLAMIVFKPTNQSGSLHHTGANKYIE